MILYRRERKVLFIHKHICKKSRNSLIIPFLQFNISITLFFQIIFYSMKNQILYSVLLELYTGMTSCVFPVSPVHVYDLINESLDISNLFVELPWETYLYRDSQTYTYLFVHKILSHVLFDNMGSSHFVI